MRSFASGAFSVLLAFLGLDSGASLSLHRHKSERRQPALEATEANASLANGSWLLFPDGSMPGPVPTPQAVQRARSMQAAIDITCRVSYPAGNIYVVSRPSLVPYLVDPQHPQRTNISVVVLPGGGRMWLAWEREGSSVAEWLNSLGVSAFVVRYRVPAPVMGPDTFLMDTQRAVSLVRLRAASLGLDAQRIGVIGFSAGGMLLAQLGSASKRAYTSIDEADAQSFRPNFHMMIYGSGPKNIPREPLPPPTFAVNSRDDPCVDPLLGEAYCRAVKAVGQRCDHHMYPTGGHGYGTCAIYTNSWTGSSVCEWVDEAKRFLGEVATW